MSTKTPPKLPTLAWEDIDFYGEAGPRMARAKVFGGWLVRCLPGDGATFIPDAEHMWDKSFAHVTSYKLSKTDMVKMYWQRVGIHGDCGDPQFSRSRVPGGWLVLSRTGGVAFMPDPQGTWGGTHGPVVMEREHEPLDPSLTAVVPRPNSVPQLLVEGDPQAPTQPPPSPKPVAPAPPPPAPPSDADLLPDVDPRVVSSEHGHVAQVGSEAGITDNHLDDSLAGIGAGFDEDPVSMEELKNRVAAQAASASGDAPAPAAASATQESPMVLVKKEHLTALQMAIAELGAWIEDEYEHPNTSARKLHKQVMIALGAVIPEG